MVVAVAASLLVMPAVIAIAGRALFWPRRLEPGVDADEQQSGKVARFATRKPVALVIVAVCAAGLGFAAFQATGLRLGFTPIHGLPSSAVERRAADAAAKGFAPGMIAPTQILVEQPGLGGRIDQVTGSRAGHAARAGSRRRVRAERAGADRRHRPVRVAQTATQCA